MKFIKLIFITLITLVIFLIPIHSSAFDVNNPGSTTGDSLCGSTTTSSSAYCTDSAGGGQNDIYGPHGLISDAINIISFIGGTVAIIVIMIGGFRYIVSGGDSNSVNGARSMILYALVGLVVIAAAQTILRFVIGEL